MREARRQHQRDPARRCVGGADEVERATHGAEVAAVGELAVDLAGQVDLDRRIDGDEGLLLRQHARRRACTRSCAAARARLSRAKSNSRPDPISSAPSMRLTTRRCASSITPSPTLPECTRSPSWRPRTVHTASGREPMPNSSTAPSGMNAAALRAMARSSSPGGRAGGMAGGRELSTTRSKSSFGKHALGVRPGHLVVHLGDDRAAGVERGHQIVGGRARGCIRRARWAG